MADTRYETVPLEASISSKPAHDVELLEIYTPPAVLSAQKKKTLLPRLNESANTSPVLPYDTPTTPRTPGFEKRSLLKRVTGTYQPTAEELDADPLERLQRQDTYLKRRIRRLKVVSRALAACLSIAVLIPLSITLHKFLSTKNNYKTVTNESLGTAPVRRSAWAMQSVTWPTYMYFAIAVISLAFNATIMTSYLHSVKAANKAATVDSFFTSGVLLLNLVVWTMSTSLYKHESTVTNDKGIHNDLWGWTCSPAAQILQPVFDDQLNFKTFCNIQAASFCIGLVQVGAIILTIVIYIFATRRLQSKKAVRRSMTAQKPRE